MVGGWSAGVHVGEHERPQRVRWGRAAGGGQSSSECMCNIGENRVVEDLELSANMTIGQ